MKKKLLSMILAVTMVAGMLTGCGGSNGGNNAEVSTDAEVVEDDADVADVNIEEVAAALAEEE